MYVWNAKRRFNENFIYSNGTKGNSIMIINDGERLLCLSTMVLLPHHIHISVRCSLVFPHDGHSTHHLSIPIFQHYVILATCWIAFHHTIEIYIHNQVSCLLFSPIAQLFSSSSSSSIMISTIFFGFLPDDPLKSITHTREFFHDCSKIISRKTTYCPYLCKCIFQTTVWSSFLVRRFDCSQEYNIDGKAFH